MPRVLNFFQTTEQLVHISLERMKGSNYSDCHIAIYYEKNTNIPTGYVGLCGYSTYDMIKRFDSRLTVSLTSSVWAVDMVILIVYFLVANNNTWCVFNGVSRATYLHIGLHGLGNGAIEAPDMQSYIC